MDKKKELISKIFARYKHGFGEEKTAAKNILEKMGINVEELEEKDQIKNDYKLNIETQFYKFFIQVFWHFKDVIAENKDLWFGYYKGDKRRIRLYDFTEIEYNDFISCWQHYIKLYKQELDYFYSAFIHTNGIFGNPRETDKQPESNSQDTQRIINLMMGIKEDKFKKTYYLDN